MSIFLKNVPTNPRLPYRLKKVKKGIMLQKMQI